MKLKRTQRWRLPFVVLAVLCALATAASFGMVFPPSFFEPVAIDGPTVFDTDGMLSVVVDSGSKRVLILNSRHKLPGIVSCNEIDSPLESVTDACVSNGKVYLAGVVYKTDSDVIEHERVVAYGTSGRSGKIVYECEESGHQLPAIKTLDNAEDGVFVVRVRGAASPTLLATMEIVHVGHKDTEVVNTSTWATPLLHDVGYSAKNNVLRALDMRGVLEDEITDAAGSSSKTGENANTGTWDDAKYAALKDCVFTSIDVADDGTTYLYDDTTNSIRRLKSNGTLKRVLGKKGCGSLHVNGDVLGVCNHTGNSVGFCKLDGSGFVELSEVEMSSRLRTLMALVMGCRLYVCLFVAVAILLKTISLVRQGQTEGIGPMFGSIVVVLVMAMAIGYISYGSYKAMGRVRANEINTFADYVDMISSQLSEDIAKCGDHAVCSCGGNGIAHMQKPANFTSM